MVSEPVTDIEAPPPILRAPETSERPVKALLDPSAVLSSMTAPFPERVSPDPVAIGLVESLNHPGGNATGVALLTAAAWTKRLELAAAIAEKNAPIGVLLNPTAENAEPHYQSRDLQAAGRALGFQIRPVNASSDGELNPAFATLVGLRVDGLVVGADPFFNSRREHIVGLAARHAIPAVYETREYADAGGLMAYGTNIKDAYRQAGVYVGRLLKGGTAADLPVLRSTKFELVINLKTARVLGLTLPPGILAIADDVIE